MRGRLDADTPSRSEPDREGPAVHGEGYAVDV